MTVLALADSCFQNDESWKIEIRHTLMHIGPKIEEIIGIKLRIKAFGYWIPWPGRPDVPAARPLADFLSSLRTHLSQTGRGPCDAVIALVPAESADPAKGLADYLGGIVILKRLKENSGMAYVLLHELCHLFGAVDMGAADSVMSRSNPSFRIDGFTRDIMRINAQRSFRSGECPLSGERIIEAMALYKESRSLGLDEEAMKASRTPCASRSYDRSIGL